MKPSKEILSNDKGYIRETGWSYSGFRLLVKPNSQTDRFVIYGRGLLENSNLLSFSGKAVDKIARKQKWTAEKLEENPDLMRVLFETSSDNIIVPDDVTTEVHTDNRRGSTVLHERLPILELSGVQVPAQVS